MSGFSSRIVDAWYQNRLWLWLLAPLSLLFFLITTLRRFAYQQQWLSSWRAPVSVIVVGNISVGGTGKTPLVIALAEHLAALGYRPGVASRGYGGHPPTTPYSVTTEDRVEFTGDEPLLVASRTGLPVVIDRDRAAACQALIERHGCNVILTDDGLQHYRLQRDMEIVVIDGRRGLGNGMVLPMGPLREPASRLATVDFVVINSAAHAARLQATTFETMHLVVDGLVALQRDEAVSAAQWPHQRTVHAVAGIGNPQRFFATLQEQGFTVIAHEFPDHHQFTKSDLCFGDDLPVVMTEKDAVKCRCLSLTGEYWFVRISASLSDRLKDAVTTRLRQINNQP